VTTPYALLDKFNDDASAQVADIMKEASMFRLDLCPCRVVFSIGSVVFLCIALFVVTLSKLFLTFVIAVGPLFVLCLAWRPTARFFDSWLSMVLNAVVLTWFAFFALGLSAFMGVPCSGHPGRRRLPRPTFNVARREPRATAC
jgi:type IV secretion system protein VirB6